MQDNDSAQVMDRVNQSEKKSYSKRQYKKLLVVGLFVLAGGLVTLAIMTERLAIAFIPQTRAQIVADVCTTDDITKFNTSIQQDYDAFRALMKDIEERSNYKDDASCVFMEYKYFHEELQYSKAVEMANRFKELVNRGHYGSNQINYDQSIATIDNMIDVMRSLPDGKNIDGAGDDN